MRKNRLLAFLACLFCTASFFAAPVHAENNAADKAKSFADGVVAQYLSESGSADVQAWIDSDLTKNAGERSEWLVITLSQYGSYRFDRYVNELLSYLGSHTVYSPQTNQKYALALIAAGSSDTYIANVLAIPLENQGIMAQIFGLHLLNNGYKSNLYTQASVRQRLLDLQLADGGWALFGGASDVDVTAMALQALAPSYHVDSVRAAAERALTFLSGRQNDTGDYSGMGVPNAESTAQVLTALSALNIDCAADPRFIKNGNTVFDGIEQYRLSNGFFSHERGKAASGSATQQCFYALVAYLRMCGGQSPLYILDRRNPQAVEPLPVSETGASTVEKSDDTPQSGLGGREETPSSDPQNGSAVSSGDPKATASADSQTDAAEPSLTASGDPDSVSKSGDARAESLESAEQSADPRVSYKPFVCVALAALCAVVLLALFLCKKLNRKNVCLVLAAGLFLILFTVFTDFESVRQYQSVSEKENAVGVVTLSIRCDTVAGKSDLSYIPEDGVILAKTEFELEENETVFDILSQAVKTHDIQMEKKGSDGLIYVASIGFLYEFQFGEMSGWVYHVNGESPFIGCDQYVLKDGDEIEWMYTLDLGVDTGNTFSNPEEGG